MFRDKHIAHLEWEPHGTKPAAIRPAIPKDDIEKLYQAVKQLFQVVCLNSEHVIDIDDYRTGEKEPRTIERLLNLVAKDIPLVNQPERRGEWWNTDRPHVDPEELRIMNEWREKLGLPPA